MDRHPPVDLLCICKPACMPESRMSCGIRKVAFGKDRALQPCVLVLSRALDLRVFLASAALSQFQRDIADFRPNSVNLIDFYFGL